MVMLPLPLPRLRPLPPPPPPPPLPLVPPPPAGDLRWDWDVAGGGLMDVGCYAVHGLRDLAPLLGGDPVPVRARVLAGPLFALDPSGLLGSLVLTVPLVRDITLAVANGEPSDPNLPIGNRLAQVLPVLSEDGAKQLAEEPGLGWIWW